MQKALPVRNQYWYKGSYLMQVQAAHMESAVRIFVSIASYCDPHLEFTLDSLFSQASRPDQITVALIDQSREDRNRFSDKSWWPHVRFVQIDPIDARGVSWARQLAFSLYEGEEFLLQIDSHTWFDPEWDSRLITMLERLGQHAEKPVLSTYPPPFEFDDIGWPFRTQTRDDSLYTLRPQAEAVLTRQSVTLGFHVVHVRGGEFVEGFHLGAGFIFTLGRFVDEIPYDPAMYFHGEEQNLAIRAYTSGWQIFHPQHKAIPLAHLYKQKEIKHDDHHWNAEHEAQRIVKWPALQQRSDQRLRELVDGRRQHSALALGSVRSLADFFLLSGIDYPGRRLVNSLESTPAADPTTASITTPVVAASGPPTIVSRQSAVLARTKDEIFARLKDTAIRIGQLDVNGKCNAKCWYCPVRYEGNPEEFAVTMAPEALDRILGRLRDSPQVAPDFRFLYSCHYNELLLYPHIEALIRLFRKHGFATMLLSNGTPLTPEKTDLIVANSDVFWGISLNIPALEQADWTRKTGLEESQHRILLRNLDYLHEKYPAHITINSGVPSPDTLSRSLAGTREESAAIAEAFQARYPNFKINVQEWLSDRAGMLGKHQVLTRHKHLPGNIIGCNHSGSEGGRIFGWVHINAAGDLFLCCDDFSMTFRFGNLLDTPLAEIWQSEAHVDAILAARDTLCRQCEFRICA